MNYEFEEYIKNAKKSLFRFEGLQDYSAEDGDEVVKIFIDTGKLAELPNTNKWWLEMKKKNKLGMITQRVRLVTKPITDYTKTELAYLKEASKYSGDDIRIIEENDLKQIAPLGIKDYWLVDNKYVLEMNYGPKGKYISYNLIEDSKIRTFIDLKTKLLEKSKKL